MRQVQVACQLSFSPIGVVDYNSEICRVLELIENSGLSADVGSMSTIVRGQHTQVLELIGQIVELQAQNGSRFIINMALSNTCGCSQ